MFVGVVANYVNQRRSCLPVGGLRLGIFANLQIPHDCTKPHFINKHVYVNLFMIFFLFLACYQSLTQSDCMIEQRKKLICDMMITLTITEPDSFQLLLKTSSSTVTTVWYSRSGDQHTTEEKTWFWGYWAPLQEAPCSRTSLWKIRPLFFASYNILKCADHLTTAQSSPAGHQLSETKHTVTNWRASTAELLNLIHFLFLCCLNVQLQTTRFWVNAQRLIVQQLYYISTFSFVIKT